MKTVPIADRHQGVAETLSPDAEVLALEREEADHRDDQHHHRQHPPGEPCAQSSVEHHPRDKPSGHQTAGGQRQHRSMTAVCSAIVEYGPIP